MDNVIKFPERRSAAANDRSERPTHGGYPDAPCVEITVSEQVVQALKFYAIGGFDHGEAARKALVAMQTAIAINQLT